MTCGIYKITNLINNMKYIGQSTWIEMRFNEHKNMSSHYTCRYLWNAFDKYGVDNFSFEILEECNENELQKRERYWIEKLNTLYPNGYNGTNGGETLSGFKFCEDAQRRKSITLKKMYESGRIKSYFKGKCVMHYGDEVRLINKEDAKKYLGAGWEFGRDISGNKNPMYGKHHSEETKKKLSCHLCGEKNPFYGKKHTEETRRIISEGRTADKNPCYNKIWITKDTSNKRIDSSELDKYTSEGWKKGRYVSEETRKRHSKVKRNRDELGHFI